MPEAAPPSKRRQLEPSTLLRLLPPLPEEAPRPPLGSADLPPEEPPLRSLPLEAPRPDPLSPPPRSLTIDGLTRTRSWLELEDPRPKLESCPRDGLCEPRE